MGCIPFGSRTSHTATDNQSTQGDGEEVTPTSVYPEDRTRNGSQAIEDTFLSSPIGSTIIQPSQGDSDEVAPPSVKPGYTLLLFEEPTVGDN